MDYLDREYSASVDSDSSCGGNADDKGRPMWVIAFHNNYVKLADGTYGESKTRVIDRRKAGLKSNPRIFNSL